MTLQGIVNKYNLIGDSDRGCLSMAEYDFLRGDTFIDKAKILYKKLQQ